VAIVSATGVSALSRASTAGRCSKLAKTWNSSLGPVEFIHRAIRIRGRPGSFALFERTEIAALAERSITRGCRGCQVIVVCP